MRVLAPHIEEELLVATQRAWMQLLHAPASGLHQIQSNDDQSVGR